MLDIIIINYKSTESLFNCLNSIDTHCNGYPYNIYVQDNDSKENLDRVKNRFPAIRLTENRKNLGFAAAANDAFRVSKSDYLMLLNPDTTIKECFFDTMIQYLDSHKDIGIIGPKILNTDGSIQGSARSFPTPLTFLFGRNSPISKAFPNNSITAKNVLTLRNVFTHPVEVDWISGACMLIRREAIQAVGGFDEHFFLYWEDADLCKRVWDAGWKVVYFPETKLIHSVGKSSSTRPVFANYQFHKSCFHLYEKYNKGLFSIFSPLAGIALMYRFLIAVFFNYFNGYLTRIKKIHKSKTSKMNPKK